MATVDISQTDVGVGVEAYTMNYGTRTLDQTDTGRGLDSASLDKGYWTLEPPFRAVLDDSRTWAVWIDGG